MSETPSRCSNDGQRCLPQERLRCDRRRALDLLEKREEALRLVEPCRTGRGQVHVPARPFYEPSLDQRHLVRGVIVHDEVNVEFGRNACFALDELL